jgi:hypothetical protein
MDICHVGLKIVITPPPVLKIRVILHETQSPLILSPGRKGHLNSADGSLFSMRELPLPDDRLWAANNIKISGSS